MTIILWNIFGNLRLSRRIL